MALTVGYGPFGHAPTGHFDCEPALTITCFWASPTWIERYRGART